MDTLYENSIAVACGNGVDADKAVEESASYLPEAHFLPIHLTLMKIFVEVDMNS